MYKQLKKQKGGTLYDYLKSSGRGNAASFNNNRKQLAQQAGISNYTGTWEQNIQLQNYLQSVDHPVAGHQTPSLEKFLQNTPNTVSNNTPKTYLDNKGNSHVEGEENTSWLQRQTNMDNAGKTPLSYRKGDNPALGFADIPLDYLEKTGASIARTVSGNAQGAGDYLNTIASFLPILSKIPAIKNAGQKGFQQLVKAITKNAPTSVNSDLISATGAGIKNSASQAINEAEGMSPKIRDIYTKLNKAEIPFINQEQANIYSNQLVNQSEYAAEAILNLNNLQMGNLPNKVRRIAAGQNVNRILSRNSRQKGGWNIKNPYN